MSQEKSFDESATSAQQVKGDCSRKPVSDDGSAASKASGSATAQTPVVAVAPADPAAEKHLITRRRFLIVWTLVGVCILTAIAVQLMNILSIPVGIILWTVVICFVLYEPVNFFEEHGIPRMWGTTLAFILMFAVLAVICVFVFSPDFGISKQFGSLIESIPDYVQNITQFAVSLYDQYADVLAQPSIREAINSVADSLKDMASSIATSSANGIIAAGTSFANVVLCVGFALIIAFWMLLELPALGREVRRLAGSEHAETMAMLHATFTRVMGGYLKGTFIQCAIIGVGCGVMFAALGASNPAALGTITGLLNIIPVVGPWLGGAVAALVCLFVSPLSALVSLVGTIIIQQAVYTFVSPKIVGDAVDIHPALMFIALMAGSAIGGAMSGLSGSLVGALLSIPAAAVLKSVFVYYFEKKTGRRLVAPDGVFFKGGTAESHVDPVADATGMALLDAENQIEHFLNIAPEGKDIPEGKPEEAGEGVSARAGK